MEKLVKFLMMSFMLCGVVFDGFGRATSSRVRRSRSSAVRYQRSGTSGGGLELIARFFHPSLPQIEVGEFMKEAFLPFRSVRTKRLLKAAVYFQERLRLILEKASIEAPMLRDIHSVRDALKKVTMGGNRAFNQDELTQAISDFKNLPRLTTYEKIINLSIGDETKLRVPILSMGVTSIRLTKAFLYIDERLRILESLYNIKAPALPQVTSVRDALRNVTVDEKKLSTVSENELSKYSNLPKLELDEMIGEQVSSFIVGRYEKQLLKAIMYFDRLLRLIEKKHNYDAPQFEEIADVVSGMRVITDTLLSKKIGNQAEVLKYQEGMQTPTQESKAILSEIGGEDDAGKQQVGPDVQEPVSTN